jgi:hypothetical protein
MGYNCTIAVLTTDATPDARPLMYTNTVLSEKEDMRMPTIDLLNPFAKTLYWNRHFNPTGARAQQ